MIPKIKDDIKLAMKNKDKEKLSTLRMLLSTIETERSKKCLNSIEDFTQDEVIGLINRNIKMLNQEIESLEKAKRESFKQHKEREVLLSYLPKQMTVEEIHIEVQHALSLIGVEIDNVGQVMKYLAQKLKGLADMSLVSKITREKFNEVTK